MDPFQVEFGRQAAVGQLLAIELAEDLVVELGVCPIGRSCGLRFALRSLAEAIEPLQAAAVKDLVDRAAAATAELEFLARLDEARRDGQSAMGTGFRWRSH